VYVKLLVIFFSGISELGVRSSAMKRVCTVFEGINEIIFEYYENAYRHYLKIVGGGVLRNAVISKGISQFISFHIQ
jgi:hypothetical protein